MKSYSMEELAKRMNKARAKTKGPSQEGRLDTAAAHAGRPVAEKARASKSPRGK